MNSLESTRQAGSLVLGTMTFGDTTDRSETQRIVDIALSSGITWIDTANVYTGGAAEEYVGKAIGNRRGAVHVASKVGMPHADAGDDAPLSPRAIRACVEGSLRRLGFDAIDLLYLHQPDRSTPIEESLEEVQRLVDEGKVGSLGISNFSAWESAELLAACDTRGFVPVTVAQQVYNLVARRAEDEFAAFAVNRNVATVIYNPLAGGLLTGRHDLSRRPSSGRFADSRLSEMYLSRYWTPSLVRTVQELGSLAEENGMPLLELALRWPLGTDFVSGVLIGGSRAEHIEQNIAILSEGPLDGPLKQSASDISARVWSEMPAYAR